MISEIVQRQQLAGSNRPYEIDASALSAPTWEANAAVAAGAFIAPSEGHETGFIYENGTSDGQTGPLEPAWAKTAGGTTADGSLTWTARVPPASGSDSIQSVTWTQIDAPDAALTITAQAHDTLTAVAYLGGGTRGNVYTVVVAVTMTSGAIYVVQIILTIL